MGRRRHRKRKLAFALTLLIVSADRVIREQHARMVHDDHHAKGRLEVVRSSVIEESEHADASSRSTRVVESTPFDSTAAIDRNAGEGPKEVIKFGGHKLHYHTYTTFNNPLTQQDLDSPYTMVYPHHPNTDPDTTPVKSETFERKTDSQSYNWFPLALAFSIWDGPATKTMFDRMKEHVFGLGASGFSARYDQTEVMEMLRVYGPHYHMDKHVNAAGVKLVGVIVGLGVTKGALLNTGLASSWKFTIKFVDPNTKYLKDPESVFYPPHGNTPEVATQLDEICPKDEEDNDKCPTEQVYANHPNDNNGVGAFGYTVGAGEEIGYETLGAPINFPWNKLHEYYRYAGSGKPRLPSPEEVQSASQNEEYKPRVWGLQRTEDLTVEEKAEATQSERGIIIYYL